MKAGFIEVKTIFGIYAINVSNIASVKPFMGGSTIVLKEIKDGANVEINTTANYESVMRAIDSVNSHI